MGVAEEKEMPREDRKRQGRKRKAGKKGGWGRKGSKGQREWWSQR